MRVFSHFNLNYWQFDRAGVWPGYAPIPDKTAAMQRKFYSVKAYTGRDGGGDFKARNLKLVTDLGDKGVVDGLVLCDATVDIDRAVQRFIWEEFEKEQRKRAERREDDAKKPPEKRAVCCGITGTLVAAWNPYSLPDNAHPADVAAAAGIRVPREIERVSYFPFSPKSPDFFWATREGRPRFDGSCLVICTPTGVFALPQASRGLGSLGRLYRIG